MRKIILIISTLILTSQLSTAAELPEGIPSNLIQYDVKSYINKSQIGMPYWSALKQKTPFLLVFANSNNIFSLVKLAPIGQMVYEEFKGRYNFCILNTKFQENQDFSKLFNVKEEPALFIINTQEKTYTYIDKKYYNKKKIKQILEIYTQNTEQKTESN